MNKEKLRFESKQANEFRNHKWVISISTQYEPRIKVTFDGFFDTEKEVEVFGKKLQYIFKVWIQENRLDDQEEKLEQFKKYVEEHQKDFEDLAERARTKIYKLEN